MRAKRLLAPLGLLCLLAAGLFGGRWIGAQRLSRNEGSGHRPAMASTGKESQLTRGILPPRFIVDDGEPSVAAPVGGLDIEIRSADGKPVENATVSVYRAVVFNDVSPDPLTKRAVDGRASFARLATGKYVVQATAKSYLPNDIVTVTIAAGSTARSTVTLERGGFEIFGYVRDGGGRPLASALVIAMPAVKVVYRRYRTLTKEDGSFEMHLPAGEFELKASAPGYASRVVAVAIPARLQVDLLLDRAASISGILRSSTALTSGQGGVVILDPHSGAKISKKVAMADPAGRFLLRDVPSGDYVLVARRGKSYGRIDRITVPAGADLRDIDLLLAEAGAVSGTVETDAGEKIAGAEVLLSSASEPFAPVLTDGAGQFLIEGVRLGLPYRMIVTREGFARRMISIAASEGNQDYSVVLTRASRIVGTILGQSTPCSVNAMLTHHNGHVFETPVVSTASDNRGEFTIEGVPPGEARVVAQCQNDLAGVSSLITIASGDNPVTIQPTKRAVVRGTVKDSVGQPASKTNVGAVVRFGKSAVFPVESFAAADGTFELRIPIPVDGAGVQVFASVNGQRRPFGSFLLVPGDTRQSDIVLAGK